VPITIVAPMAKAIKRMCLDILSLSELSVGMVFTHLMVSCIVGKKVEYLNAFMNRFL